MKREITVITLLIICVLLPGYTLGQKKQKGFKFDDVVINIETSGTKSIAYTTHDQRETIRTEHRDPNFAGYLRNMWGMGYPTATATLNPLADDMTTAVSSSLTTSGFNTTGINVPFTDSPEEVLEKLINTESDLLIIFTLIEWHGDGYAKNTDVKFEVSFKVYDERGQLLVEKTDGEMGRIIRPDKPKNVWDQLKVELPKFFKEQMEGFFNDPDVKKHLE
jgi:hypothetical protein